MAARPYRTLVPHNPPVHGADVKEFQRALNRHATKGHPPVKADGYYGHESHRLFLYTAWERGYPTTTLRRGATPWAQRRLESRWPRPRAMVKTARSRRGKKNPYLQPPPRGPFTNVDGKVLATWIANIVIKVRAGGRWKGHVISGYRTPAYSESLCYAMCGAPSCPGRCAGRATNHSRFVYPGGAVDVDAASTWVFRAELKRLGLDLQNNLPNDINHYSQAGN